MQKCYRLKSKLKLYQSMIVREFVNVGQCREVVPAYWLRFREFFDFLLFILYNRKYKRKEIICRKIMNIIG